MDETSSTSEYTPPATVEGIMCGSMIGIIIFCIASIVIMVMYKNREIKIGVALLGIIMITVVSSFIAIMLFNKF